MGKREIRQRAVFLDRDGVLNRSIIRDGLPYPPSTVDEFELFPDVPAGCARLKAAGFLLVVITNQPDVGRATQTKAAVEALHEKLRRALPGIDEVEVCYHGGKRYGQSCDCRKPEPGMIHRAAARSNIDLTASYVIGDRWRDIDCARAAGCRAVFIERGYAEALRSPPDFTVKNFSEAVEAVLRDASAPLYSLPSRPLRQGRPS